jgi:hypothetical protein
MHFHQLFSAADEFLCKILLKEVLIVNCVKKIALGMRPSCVLCPNMGGAMKATRSGQKWAHVACAIWIPEVSIGSVEKMEPITKISAIPVRFSVLLSLKC